jgi:holo-[acyl-carrier protein] synthase
MIHGIGTDLTDIKRIAGVVSRSGARLAERILHPDERLLHQTARDPIRDLSKRWAAKEAFAKALGTGVRGFNMHDIALLRGDLGRPLLRLSERVQEICADLGAGEMHVSISDEGLMIAAFVVIERR